MLKKLAIILTLSLSAMAGSCFAVGSIWDSTLGSGGNGGTPASGSTSYINTSTNANTQVGGFNVQTATVTGNINVGKIFGDGSALTGVLSTAISTATSVGTSQDGAFISTAAGLNFTGYFTITKVGTTTAVTLNGILPTGATAYIANQTTLQQATSYVLISSANSMFVGNGGLTFRDKTVLSSTNSVWISSGAGTVTPFFLANTAVTPGSYAAPTISIDAQGRITLAASNVLQSTVGVYVNGALTAGTSNFNFTSAFSASVNKSTVTVDLNYSSVTAYGPNIPATAISAGALGASVMTSSAAAGSISVNQLVNNGGNPSATTFYRGDGQWATPAGGTGGGSGVSISTLANGGYQNNSSETIKLPNGVSGIFTRFGSSDVIDLSNVAVKNDTATWSATQTLSSATILAGLFNGTLGLTVMTSSVAAVSVSTPQIVNGAIIDALVHDVGASKISAGALGSSVLTSSVAGAAVGIAQLSASGTPSATTFLRGDNTWATPAGSGGSGSGLAVSSQGSGGFQSNSSETFKLPNYVGIFTRFTSSDVIDLSSVPILNQQNTWLASQSFGTNASTFSKGAIFQTSFTATGLIMPSDFHLNPDYGRIEGGIMILTSSGVALSTPIGDAMQRGSTDTVTGAKTFVSTSTFSGPFFVNNTSVTINSVQISSSILTQQGNTFNSANQLVQLDVNGLIPNGSISPSSVTKFGTNVPQFNSTNTLTGAWTFQSTATHTGALVVNNSSTSFTGVAQFNSNVLYSSMSGFNFSATTGVFNTASISSAVIGSGVFGGIVLSQNISTGPLPNLVMASSVATSAVGIAQLSATGSPSASNFLRGDNTWAVPSGGGGSSSGLNISTLASAGFQNNSSETIRLPNVLGIFTRYSSSDTIDLTQMAVRNDTATWSGLPTFSSASILAGLFNGTLGTTVMTSSVAASAVGIAQLSASGVPGITTFLRGDNSWAIPAGGTGAGAAIGFSSRTGVGFSVIMASVVIHSSPSGPPVTVNASSVTVDLSSVPVRNIAQVWLASQTFQNINASSASFGVMTVTGTSQFMQTVLVSSSMQITGELHAPTTAYWYFTAPNIVSSTAPRVYADTDPCNGQPMFDNNTSILAGNWARYTYSLSTATPITSDPSIDNLIFYSSAADSGNYGGVLSISTTSTGGNAATIVGSSTTAPITFGTTFTSAPSGGGYRQSGRIVLTGWKAILQAGGGIAVIQIGRDTTGDTSTINACPQSFIMQVPIQR